MRKSLVVGLVVLSFAVRAAAQCPEEAPLLNYQGGGTVVCPCFIAGEEAGVVLDAPAGHYPIEITKIRIAWASQFGGNPQSLEQAVKIYPAGLPAPGVAQMVLPGPLLTDQAINEFNVSTQPGRIVNSGPFMISLQFANNNAGNPFASSVAHDGNGCTGGGKNTVFAIPGGWSDACLLGVTGDWVMEVVYKQVNCLPAQIPTLGEWGLGALLLSMLVGGAWWTARQTG